MRGQRWRPLLEFATDELPRPLGPMRAGDYLGADRRFAQFYGQHAEKRIEVEAWDPITRKTVHVKHSDMSRSTSAPTS
jgi:hypothetical protein